VVTFLLGFYGRLSDSDCGKILHVINRDPPTRILYEDEDAQCSITPDSKPDAEIRNDQTESINQDRWANMQRG